MRANSRTISLLLKTDITCNKLTMISKPVSLSDIFSLTQKQSCLSMLLPKFIAARTATASANSATFGSYEPRSISAPPSSLNKTPPKFTFYISQGFHLAGTTWREILMVLRWSQVAASTQNFADIWRAIQCGQCGKQTERVRRRGSSVPRCCAEGFILSTMLFREGDGESPTKELCRG